MTSPPLTESDIARWFFRRGVAIITAAVMLAGAWTQLRTEIAALRVQVEQIDVEGSHAVRGMRPAIDSLRGDVREIKRYLCGDRPLCARGGPR
jgi:hypothetical protein